MKVLVTGASGFVGCHTVAALVDRGHEVRAMVRSTSKLRDALAPLGSPAVEIAEGDVLDPPTVRDAVDGCEAVVNAANVYTFDAKRNAEMTEVNVTGTATVLDAAVKAGCDPVVHVSSFVAALPHDGPVSADPPIGRRTGHVYLDSKKGAEEEARRHQEAGAPVVTTYPGQVFGPHDPGSGEMVSLSRAFLKGRVVPGLSGHIGIVDVTWLAALHAALIEPERGPRRVPAPGTTLTWAEFIGALRDAAGRPRPVLLPTPMLMGVVIGRTAQRLARMTGRDFALSPEGPWLVSHWQDGDDHLARELVGDPPPIAETISVAVRSMADTGQLDQRHVGDLPA